MRILTLENIIMYNDNMVFRDFVWAIKIHICKSIIKPKIIDTQRT